MQMDRDREFKMEESGQKRRETRYKQSKRLRQFRHGEKACKGVPIDSPRDEEDRVGAESRARLFWKELGQRTRCRRTSL